MKRPTPTQMKHWLAVAALAAIPAASHAASGQFTFVVGDVSLAKAGGQRSTPAKGTPVDPGDRIVTGANGMAQLTMVDNARLSLRPSTQFVIEQYPERRDSDDGVVLSLVKGTLRAFTGLIASTNREKFVMKTRVATVGIRGSGNILYACEAKECDESVAGAGGADGPITVNHTIEGAHAVTNILAGGAPGLPAQQGGPQTVITGPGQTVLVAGSQPPRYIPTPGVISNAATSMVGAKVQAAAGEARGDTRDFAPGDVPALPSNLQTTPPTVGSLGPGFVPIDATGNLAADPLNLHDVLIVAGSPFLGQALHPDVFFSDNDFRGYRSYAGSQSGVQPTLSGGTLRDANVVSAGGVQISYGRHENASLGFFGSGSASVPGSIHWIVAPSGYPTFLSDVLTGSASYGLVAATSPTNQNNVAGNLGSAALDVNFSNRTLNFRAALNLPSQGSTPGGDWIMSADNVPISFNTFFASTGDRLLVRNGTGQSSTGNENLAGSFEGSFVGTGLTGAIMGYGIQDSTAANPAHWHFISGVAAFAGPRQDAGAPYREARVSDPAGTLSEFVRSYAATIRPDEVTSDAEGRATAFVAPFARTGTFTRYDIGSAQVVQSGVDPETGMIWGRWANGVATLSRDTATSQLFLNNASLHYIFAGTQTGPVALPLTGVGVYDVIGSTNPTDFSGHVGTLNSATLNANFTARTVDASVNVGINGQTWTGSASNMPIYRDQYFSAYSGTPIPGVPNPSPLAVGCSPGCGQGAGGSFDGFFTGRSGQRAGMLYNLGGVQGAIAFGRRGGGG